MSVAKIWIHLGANIGAAHGPGNILQASDNEMESMIANAMTSVGLGIDHRHPCGAEPLGEAANVYRGRGRFISVIGKNNLFHNRIDQGASVVDLNVIQRFASSLTRIATSLTSV